MVVFLTATTVLACQFQCPDGGTPVARKEHLPSTNGCGTFGIKVGTEFHFEPCCDDHDLCYDTCGRGKAQHKQRCDERFGTCMLRYCQDSFGSSAERLKSCTGAANLFKMGTVGFGCGAYLTSQQSACQCLS
ncbi:MAG: hypothetical protein Q8P67_07640 [archaeon]|nr:hypothetical protein [archaeon]